MKSWPKQTYSSMVEFYGQVGENQTLLVLPYEMKLAWDTTTTIKRIRCHEKVTHSVYTIFEKTLKLYGLKDVERLRLNLFGGCLNVRAMRGGTKWSTHSWGVAIDIDPDRNQLRWGKEKASLAKPAYQGFWEIVEKEGWTSLGRTKNYDYMHFQACSL